MKYQAIIFGRSLYSLSYNNLSPSAVCILVSPEVLPLCNFMVGQHKPFLNLSILFYVYLNQKTPSLLHILEPKRYVNISRCKNLTHESSSLQPFSSKVVSSALLKKRHSRSSVSLFLNFLPMVEKELTFLGK